MAKTTKQIQAEIRALKEELATLRAAKKPVRTKIVTNLMSGKLTRIPVDTPFCCDPSTETYWSM